MPTGPGSARRRSRAPQLVPVMHVRFAALALSAILAAALVPTAAVTAATPDPRALAVAPSAALTPAQAVSRMVAMVNADRAGAGLRPLRPDTRMMQIAQVRADTMARENRMSHVSKAGVSVFDLIRASKVTWYVAGENIAWTDWPALADSVRETNRGWMGSPSHRAIILSTQFNYIGIGLATRADGGRFWSAVFLRGPDRTAPRVTSLRPLLGSTVVFPSGTTNRRVTWRWTGGDVPLAALTAGLRTFQVQRRVDGRRWVLVAQTRSHSLANWVPRGHRTEVRVRGIDRRGNVGAWSAPVRVDF
jgi:uncharacterized protein YkwD